MLTILYILLQGLFFGALIHFAIILFTPTSREDRIAARKAEQDKREFDAIREANMERLYAADPDKAINSIRGY